MWQHHDQSTYLMASLSFEHIAASSVDSLARSSTTQMTRRRGTNYASMHCSNCYGMNNLNDLNEDLACQGQI